MKLTTILILTGVMYASASSYAQEHRVSVQVKDGTFYDVVTQIEKQSEFMFFYKSEEIDNNQRVTLVAKNKLVADILNELVENQHLAYRIIDKHIIITKVPPVTQQQGKRITGTVTDAATGESIIGANILEKGVTNGTITDVDGKFTLTVSENATLQVSYIGYLTQEIAVGNQTTLQISLKESSWGLDEVVVVGYGTQKKVNLTGAVASVSGDEMIKRPVSNPVTMLQGQIPGLSIVQGTGQPGAESVSMRIRGQGTYSSAGSDPLVLIDGVPGNLSNLNANDIETVSVLKDASSAA
ncbi:MAG: carboxypeptidase-like regulatory domain-containing protein, partial [Tannerella sp.]|nr:carboxypeptidase-like regulatory domain-containing protein [Tannerella sp.]